MKETSYNKWFEILLKEMREAYSKAPMLSDSHGEDHILRVWKTAERLGKDLDADMEVMIAATLLHDLGRHYPGGEGKHGPKSAELAKPILEKISFPSEKIESVLDAIAKHDFQTDKSERKSKESQVLYDADKVDFFGVKGIARAFLLFPKRGKDIKWIIDAFTGENSRIEERYKNLHFEKTKEMVEEKYNYMKDFFEKLKDEIE